MVFVFFELNKRQPDQRHTGMACTCFGVMAETFHTALGVSVVLQLFIEPLCSVEMTAHTIADFA